MGARQRIGQVVGSIVGLALAAGAIASVFLVDWRREKPVHDPVVRPLKTMVVGDAPVSERRFPARVHASTEVVLAFEVPGIIERLNVVRGQRVKRGDLLAQLDQRDFRSRLASAQAQLDQLSTELSAVTRAFERGAATDIERARFQTSVERARADREMAQKSLEDATLAARFDGIVADVFVDQYQKVGPGAPVLRLQTNGIANVEVNVDPERVAFARLKEPSVSHVVRFDFAPGRELPAKLIEYTTQADPATQTFRAIFEIVLPDDLVILPGMPATVIERATEGMELEPGQLGVPVEVVAIDGAGKHYVWLVKDAADGTALVHRVDVEVGEIVDDSIVVSRGLKQGQTIAAAGVHQLVEGQRVRPMADDSGTATR
ncbi:MAG: efflux RND transporter periplasmic adaptor subunit [Phycisphaerales bacterium]